MLHESVLGKNTDVDVASGATGSSYFLKASLNSFCGKEDRFYAPVFRIFTVSFKILIEYLIWMA